MGTLFYKWFARAGVLIVSMVAVQASDCSAGERYFFTGVRANQAQIEAICKAIPDCELLDAEAKEFSNGNTFVTFKTRVTRRNLVILIPDQISANDFMEALIKVRTAKTQGALRIAPIIPKDGVKILVESGAPLSFNAGEVQMLVRAAGADSTLQSLSSAPAVFEPFHSRPTVKHPHEFNELGRSIVVGLGHNSLAQDLANDLGLAFVNGTLPNQINVFSGVKHVVLVAPPVVPANESFLRALSWVNYYNQSYRITWVSTYLPYARSDKIDQPGVAVIGRLAADLMETVGTGEVVLVRPHAPQSQGFFRIPSLQITGRKTIVDHLKSLKIDVIIAPDAGAQKDDTLYAKDLGIPVNVINKARDPKTGVSRIIDMIGIDVAGLRVAVIDDETASGGTLDEASEFLRKRGASYIAAVVTHLAGDAARALKSPNIDQMVVTDTLPIEVKTGAGLKVLPISTEIASEFEPWLSLKTCEADLTGD